MAFLDSDLHQGDLPKWRCPITLVFEVSRMADPALRMACVKGLSEGGFKLTKMAFNEDATYSRFYSAARPVRDSGDDEKVRDAIEALVGKAKEVFPKVEAVLKNVFLTTK
jgi:hypothetical protein